MLPPFYDTKDLTEPCNRTTVILLCESSCDEMRKLKGTERRRFSLFLSVYTRVKTWALSGATKSLSGRRQFYKAAEEDVWRRRRCGGLGKASVGAAGVAVPLLAALHYGRNLQTRLNRETPVPHLQQTLRKLLNTELNLTSHANTGKNSEVKIGSGTF